jgi:hypothetical protein
MPLNIYALYKRNLTEIRDATTATEWVTDLWVGKGIGKVRHFCIYTLYSGLYIVYSRLAKLCTMCTKPHIPVWVSGTNWTGVRARATFGPISCVDYNLSHSKIEIVS